MKQLAAVLALGALAACGVDGAPITPSANLGINISSSGVTPTADLGVQTGPIRVSVGL